MLVPVEGKVTSDAKRPMRYLFSNFARYTGEDPEPRPGLSSGHIPHSKSVPFNTFLENHQFRQADGSTSTYTTLRSPTDILETLRSALGEDFLKDVLERKRNIVTTCGSGMTAGVLWLGLKTLGIDNVGLYDEVRLLTSRL